MKNTLLESPHCLEEATSMIAISKRSKEDREQPRMRAPEASSRSQRVHFDAAENTRFYRFPSQPPPREPQPREPLEIISERRQIRTNLRGVATTHQNQAAMEDVYRHKYQISNSRVHGKSGSWPFRRPHSSQAAWHPRNHIPRVHRVTSASDREAALWPDRKSPSAMKPVPASASYWGWKEHRPQRQYKPPSYALSDEQPSNQTVAVTVSNDESPSSETTLPPQHAPGSTDPMKRQLSPSANPSFKRQKGLDRLNILVRASLEMGPMQLNPTGCSCPKSKCVALYCECFKAGRRCDPKSCTCSDCRNTLGESGPNGARTLAIRSILARNPRAFLTAGTNQNQAQKLAPGEVACNCLRSRCLKLYCTCFQQQKTCKEGICSCVGCLNTDEDTTGDRKHAIKSTLEKRPDAFDTRTKQVGLGCACKNNRCIRKYCECFRNGLACSDRCSCSHCENKTDGAIKPEESTIVTDDNPAVAEV